MSRRGLIALVLASALVTFDGTAVTVALAEIGRDLQTRFSTLQWIPNASLVMLAALVIPFGALGDRLGRRRAMQLGLVLFAAASVGCALAPGPGSLITARLAQGTGAALLLPGAIAILRASHRDEIERTRAFGLLAAGTGLAGVVGPVAGGALVDFWSWRAVFVASAALTVPAIVLLSRVPERRVHDGEPPTLTGALKAMARVPNCIAANVVTAALYFGMFGVSFLLPIYTQNVLGRSATWAGISVLPIAAALLFSDRLAGLASRRGSRVVITIGGLLASGGILWLAVGPSPLPFWSHLMPAMTIFGIGLAVASGPLTHAAVSSLPSSCAGTASGVHHAVVRAAGLIAIAVVGSLPAVGANAEGDFTSTGFRIALAVCGVVILVFGVGVGRKIVDDACGGIAA